MQGKMSEKNSSMKTQRKKFMHKMGRILILNKNYDSSRKVFQNEPNGIRASIVPGHSPPGHPYGKGNLPNAESLTQNAERETKSPKRAKPNRSAIQTNRRTLHPG